MYITLFLFNLFFRAFPVYRRMFDDIPDPKKIEEFNLQSVIKTLGNFILIKIIPNS